MPPLVSTKLAPPRVGPETVWRSRLDFSNDAVACARLALLRAPAGFGKTTVLLRWWEQLARELSCAWLTVDRYDNDAQRFTAHLTAALARAGLTIEHIDNQEFMKTGSFAATFAACVCAALDSRPVRVALFLDDVEALEAEDALDVIRHLIDIAGPKLLIVIATRSNPRLGQARLRVSGSLFEIVIDKLRFDLSETRSVIESHLGKRLSPVDVCNLHDRADGWPAAIQLASLALAGHIDPGKYVRTFSGIDSDFAEYFAQDLLARLPEDTRSFLLTTSLLDRLNGPLCDAVTHRVASEAKLSELEASGLFLRRLETDAAPAWYRYHPLFAEYLRGQSAFLGDERANEIHRDAATWYRLNGDFYEAAEHALAGHDTGTAATLIEAVAMASIERGQLETILTWAGRLPRETLQEHRSLLLAYLWAISFVRRQELLPGAFAILEVQEEAFRTSAPELGDHLTILKAIGCSFADDWEAMRRTAFETWSRQVDETTWHFGVLANIVAHCYIMTGNYLEARSALARGRASLERADRRFGIAYAYMLEAMTDLAELRADRAVARLQAGVETGLHPSTRSSHPGAVAAPVLAEALYEQNDIDRAELVLEQNLALAADAGIPDAVATAYLTLARIKFLRGADDTVRNLLEEAQQVGLRRRLPRLVDTFRYELLRLVHLAGGHITSSAPTAVPWQTEYRTRDIMTTADALSRDIGTIRLSLLRGDHADIAEQLAMLIVHARERCFYRRELTLGVLRAIALSLDNNETEAEEQMASSVVIGVEHGFVRTFLDEGPIAVRLLHAVRSSLEHRCDRNKRLNLGVRLDALLKSSRGDRFSIPSEPIAPGPLTARELQLVHCLAEGLSNRDLSARLALSEKTVKWHLRNIFGKLHVVNRTEAVFLARRSALIP